MAERAQWPLNKVEIEGRAPAITVKVDGRMLPCSSAVLEVDAESLPVLTVKLLVADGAVVALGGVSARIEEETRAALVAMGWTPPMIVISDGPPMTETQVREFRDAVNEFAGGSDCKLVVLPPSPEELSWLLHLDHDDMNCFTDDLRYALRDRDPAALATCLREWRVTAEALADPELRAALTAPPGDADFTEVQRPGGES